VAIGRYGAAARQLDALFHLGAAGPLTDGQLLERFATRPGEGAELAFAALVERHGPLVLRVCRSVLRDEHAAHDAFQATFLVLVDKGRSLWVRDSLAPWLHAVAYRVALCARGSAARRRRHERAIARVDAGQGDDGIAEARELGSVLHEEIEALPERYRVPIVLCDLEGRSHDEAARHLGWPVGTVKSRQARGRDRLRTRLVRRGVAPAIGLGIGETVSPALAHATAAVAAKGVGAAPAPVAALSKEFLMGILIGKLKWAVVFLVGLALAATGALAFSPGGGKGRRALLPRRLETVVVQAEAPADRAGKIYFGSDGGMVAVDPKTGEASRLLIQCNHRPRVSPDGRLVAYEWEGAIWVRVLEKADNPKKVLDLDGAKFGTPPVWSPDSSKLIISLGREEKVPEDQNHWRHKTVRINVDGSGLEELKIPAEDGVQDWAPGDWLVTESGREAKIGWQIYVMKPDGSEMRQVTEGGNPWPTRFSPDGKRILYADGTTAERRGIWVVGLDGKDRRKVISITGAWQWSACWSPDGKRIAVLVADKPDAERVSKGRLILKEVDGDGQVEFPLEDLKVADMPDWR
jgi:RNA polymerase sigma factor (sigma-70 family)